MELRLESAVVGLFYTTSLRIFVAEVEALYGMKGFEHQVFISGTLCATSIC
jgi:hypothetical protein